MSEAEKEYRASPLINASLLKCFAGQGFSPASALHQMRTKRPQTTALSLGTLVHGIIENQGLVPSGFAVSPFKDFRAKEAQGWKADMEKAGKMVLKAEEFDQGRQMAENLMLKIEHPYDGLLKPNALREVPVYNGEFKALLDVASPNMLIGADIKTTRHTNIKDIKRDFDNLFYHLQFYHYKMVSQCEVFGSLIVSSVEPYHVFQAPASDEYLAFGKWEWTRAYDRLMTWRDKQIDNLPAEEFTLDAPSWWLKENA